MDYFTVITNDDVIGGERGGGGNEALIRIS